MRISVLGYALKKYYCIALVLTYVTHLEHEMYILKIYKDCKSVLEFSSPSLLHYVNKMCCVDI